MSVERDQNSSPLRALAACPLRGPMGSTPKRGGVFVECAATIFLPLQGEVAVARASVAMTEGAISSSFGLPTTEPPPPCGHLPLKGEEK